MNNLQYFTVSTDSTELESFKLSLKNCTKFLTSLIECDGQLTSSLLFGDESMAYHTRDCTIRIALPPANINKFLNLTGFRLIESEVVRGQQLEVN